MPPITANQKDYCKVAQLYYALKKAKSDKEWEKIITDLVQQIDDVNLKVPTNKWSYKSSLTSGTPLHVAVFHKHVWALNSLLKRRADFTIQNKDTHTALHQAFIDIFSESSYEFRITPEIKSGIIINASVNSMLDAHVEHGIYKNPRAADGLSHFHIACAANHVKAVKMFLDTSVSVNELLNIDSRNFAGYTPLHFAAKFCGYETAKLLLERGANVYAKDPKGISPLHLVVDCNFKLIELKNKTADKALKDKIDRYIEQSQKTTSLFLSDNRMMDVDCMGFHKSHVACILKDSLLAERFLQDIDVNHVISMNSPMWPGYTRLHFAVHFNIETVKLLLKKGADIGAEDAKGKTPFDFCAENYNSEDIHSVLLAIQATKDVFFSDNKTRLSDFIHATQSVSTLESFFQTTSKNIFLPHDCHLWPGYYLSHLFVQFSRVKGFDAKKLFSIFSDTASMRDAHGRTPLHLAFYQCKFEIIDLFFEHQSEITNIIDNNNLSHLYIACKRNHERAVRTLLSQGSHVNIVYKGKKLCSEVTNSSTALHISVSMRNVEIVKMLVGYGADVNAADADGMTPIHRFIRPSPFDTQNVKEIGDLLFSSREIKNVFSKSGLSHMHVASYAGNENAVKILLNLGADAANSIFLCDETDTINILTNMARYSGYTPLHFALEFKHMQLAELLIQGGADVFQKRPRGMTLVYDLLDIRGKGIFKEISIGSELIILMTSLLNNKTKLQNRAKNDSGLTKLHIACHFRDADQMERLLTDSQIDVNARMHENSPIWSKCTPLHLLLEHVTFQQSFKYQVQIILKRGADVTMVNDVGNTPVHSAYWGHTSCLENHGVLRLLLTYHKNFRINPVNRAGISHFHLACIVNEYTIVEKFLQNGVDVNLPIYHLLGGLSFQTPLLYMMKSLIHSEARLTTMDILLKYGADVNAQDEKSLTPFLRAAQLGTPIRLYLEKLYNAGADDNYIALSGKSALEMLIRATYTVTVEDILFFISKRNFYNAYNSMYGIGIISITISKLYHATEERQSILEGMMEVPSLFTIDQMGRTPIHNIVANFKTILNFEEYANYIERFVKMGYDIDAQDCEGKTALHLAAHFSNHEALSGLLSAGADLNLIDNSNQTVLTVLLQFRLRKCKKTIISEDINEQATNVIAFHIITLLLCNFEVNSCDFKLIESKRFEEKFVSHREQVSREIEMSKMLTVGTESVTLRDFLSETGAVASRPSMVSETDRQAADNLLEYVDVKAFPKIKGLIKLQYRKMVERLPLMNVATDSIRQLLGSINGFSMPDICCRMILRLLSNIQVKNVITSVSTEKTALKLVN